ncbi:hypothetical protein GCM10010441_72390 [Kitasatospora paracochleata]|uniref:Chromosome segregation ATPase n=1 Tax=Kitasatospora paracochleata TaxID=58354 RepID=A0ABT1JA42_9ACTN|nr:hypothetical protein [Kitasatospora paracochleata]MCP2313979.1 chromosome segregation ATPase [Kitasatospora paracochleata]
MTTPYGGDADHQIRQLGRTIDDIESSLRRLRDDHEHETSSAGSRLDSAEYKLRDHQNEIEQLDERADETDSELKGLQGSVDDLTQRVAWIERRLRTAAGGSAVDLDATTGEIDQLLTKIIAGLAAEARLLPEAERARHAQNLHAHSQATSSLEQARVAVLTATGILATAAHDSDAFKTATTDYRLACTKMANAAARVEQLRSAAGAARKALDRDESLDQTLTEAADAGDAARDRLAEIARARISNAITGSDLLPVWFTTALGPMPPRSGTERWLAAATEALVYRLTYGVRDEIVALGHIPAQATARQRADHKDAEQGLRL